jgi:hypothetical protein
MNKKMKKRLSTFNLASLVIVMLVGLFVFNFTTGKDKLYAADSCTPPATTFGTDTMTGVSVPATSNYDIWVRMEVPAVSVNGVRPTILLNIDGKSCFNVGGAIGAANTWTWVDYSDGNTNQLNAINLTQGPHTFTLTGTSSGVSVDRILALVPGASCLPPTGTGTNCTPALVNNPTVSITNPANGGTVSGNTNVAATAAESGGTIQKVQFELDGKPLNAAVTTNPFSTTWNTNTTTNGSHALTAIATDSSGNSVTSSTVTVTVNNNGGGGKVLPSVPGVPSVQATTSTFTTFNSIPLKWAASTDNGGPGVGGYIIFRNGVNVGTSKTNSFTDLGLSPGTTYTYTIEAEDSASTPQVSGQSPALSARTNIIGDLDGDGTVTAHDLSILISHFNTNYPPAEFDNTNSIEAHDLSIFITNFGK